VERVEEHLEEVGGLPAFWRSAPSADPPVVYLHGAPTSSEDWLPFLAKTGGVAPDLPGFGRSGKGGHLDYSIAGYDAFLEALLAHLGIDRFRLVVHDWGVAGLALAQRAPERVERLVIINALPLLPGYRWHPIARLWRRRVVGEVVMGLAYRWTLGLIARLASRGGSPPPPELLDRVWAHFDPGTQRAILRLYRSGDPDVLAAAGARLGGIAAPALVVWGERDPYIPAHFADAYGAALPKARVERLADAGHWPWLDDPAVVDRVAEFLVV
jgi:pimeloyl-ACP methyl ester carboxylesterase